MAGLAGSGPGAAFVPARSSGSRLARQTAKLPRERASAAGGNTWECWQLDMTGWVDLPNRASRTDAGRRLFGRARSHADAARPLARAAGRGVCSARKKVTDYAAR